MKRVYYLAYRDFALSSYFTVLLSGFSSPAYSKCMASDNFQTCIDHTGNISSVSSLPINSTFPEASDGGSDLDKQLKAIQGKGVGNLGPGKTRYTKKEKRRQSQNGHDLTNCILGPVGSTC